MTSPEHYRATLFHDLYHRPARSWFLAGPAGTAVLTAISLPWLAPDVVIDGEGWKAHAFGVHTWRPLHDGQKPYAGECSFKHGLCYFTVSEIPAASLLCTWADTRGSEIWAALDREYAKTEQLPPVTWFCRVCESAMAGPAAPADPICPDCARAGRITELTAHRTALRARLDAIEVELSRLSWNGSGIGGDAA